MKQMEECNRTNKFASDKFCDWHWDSLICWPATEINKTITKACPMIRGSETSKTVSKYCDLDGTWKSTRVDGNNSSFHMADYSECFTKEIINLIYQLQRIPSEELQMKMNIAKMTRLLELTGLSISLMSLVVCFVIYYYFRSLRNERTRIHMNLFGAVFGIMLMKLILFVDQLLAGYGNIGVESTGFDNTPVLCETAYIILEYFKSATYMWMFIEALHLHRAIAVTATKMSFKRTYLLWGWGFTIVFIVVWICAMVAKPRTHCWWGYNYNRAFWILEAPRITILLTNMGYLIHISKVVFLKMGRNTSDKMKKIRKTVKSIMKLLPLFGITNCMSYAEPTYDGSVWYFGCYSFISYFLTSFQGLFVCLMFFLLTDEVKDTIFNANIGFMSNSSGSSTGSQQFHRKTQKNLDEDLSVENSGVV